MIQFIKSSAVILLSLVAAFFIAIFFFADFGPGETIYTRSFMATLFAAAASIMLGYTFRMWWLGFLPVLFPLMMLTAGIIRSQTIQFDEFLAFLIPLIGSFAAAHLGGKISRRVRTR